MLDWALSTFLWSTEMINVKARPARTASMESLRPSYEKLFVFRDIDSYIKKH